VDAPAEQVDQEGVGIGHRGGAPEEEIGDRSAAACVGAAERDVLLDRVEILELEIVGLTPALPEKLGEEGIHALVAGVAVAHVPVPAAQVGPLVEDKGAVEAALEIARQVAEMAGDEARVSLVDVAGVGVGVADVLAALEEVEGAAGVD